MDPLPYVAFLVTSKPISATEEDTFAHAEYSKRGYEARLPGFEAQYPAWTGCAALRANSRHWAGPARVTLPPRSLPWRPFP